MGFLDWLRRPFVETTAPPPKVPDSNQDPVGSVGQIDPLAATDRKNAVAVISAALRTEQERSRAARYLEFDAMDQSDMAAMLDAVTANALTFDDVSSGFGFKLECDDLGAEEILKLAIERTGLDLLTEELLRDMLKYGDAFAEPVFDKGELTKVQTYAPAEIYRAQDDKGRLMKGTDDDGFKAAFQQKRQGRVLAGWLPHEMTHFKLWPSQKRMYSVKGMLDDIRADWRKLQLVEQGMVVARITRAYPRRVHYVDMTNKDRKDQERTLTGYIARMTNKVFGRKPSNQDGLPIADVSEDLYVATGYQTGADGKQYPKLNRVETEDPAIAGLEAMGDVQYLRQKIWSFVPSDIVGIKRNTSTEADSQDLAYARFLRRAQRQLEVGIRNILMQVLLAKGRIDVDFRIIWPQINTGAQWKYADARFRDSMTARNYIEMGAMSRKTALKQAYNMSDRQVEQEWEQIEWEMNSPLFAPVLPYRNGLPSTANGIGKPGDSQIDNPQDDGKPTRTSLPTAASGPGAATLKQLDKQKAKAVTASGVYRGTRQAKITRGFMSGG